MTVVGDTEGLAVMRGLVELTVADSEGLGITRDAVGLTVIENSDIVVLFVLVMLARFAWHLLSGRENATSQD